MLRLEGLLDGLLRLTAFGLLISMLVAALHDVSQAWDVWYYHLPFGARLWGLVPQSDFIFTDENGARFSGFPLLGEWLQGLLWRLTRLPTAANLVAFSSVPAVAVFLRIRFGVPLHLTVVALLAIPLVQTHATSCYVDLPANSAVAVLVMLTLDAYARRTRLSMRTLLLAFCVAALAANMKMPIAPLNLHVSSLVRYPVPCVTSAGSGGPPGARDACLFARRLREPAQEPDFASEPILPTAHCDCRP